MSNCFDNAYVETVNHCPNDETVGGTAVDLFYIPAAHLETYTKPTVTATSTFADRITLAALTPKTSKGFKRLSIMVDENELSNLFVGSIFFVVCCVPLTFYNGNARFSPFRK